MLMKRIGCVGFLLLALFAFSACAQYKYNGVNYDSPQKALTAQKRLVNSWINQVNKYDKPSFESILLVIPSYERLKDEYRILYTSGRYDSAHFEYVVQSSLNSLLSCKDALEQRNFFKNIRLEGVKHPEIFAEEHAKEYDAVLCSRMINSKQRTWFLSTPDSAESIEISFNKALPPVLMINHWLDEIEKEVNK